MTASRCPVCRSPAESQAEALLQAGTSYRGVARLTGLNRTSLARHHREHMTPVSRRLTVLPQVPDVRGPDTVDPMAEALWLLDRATTQREKMRALEAVRAASWLALRQAGAEPDAALLEQLEANISQASAMFREVSGFESQLYGLAGVREAIRQRIAAIGRARQSRFPSLSNTPTARRPDRTEASRRGTCPPLITGEAFRANTRTCSATGSSARSS
jgi:hypothetical protein